MTGDVTARPGRGLSPRRWRERLVSRARQVWQAPAGQLLPLDALRAIAITMVFAAHWAGEFDALSATQLPHVLGRVLTLGWAGVDLFFVLSGLLIGRQLWSELRERGSIDVPRFLLRRGFRIWPLYFATIAAIWLARPWLSPAELLPDLLFYSNYVNAQVPGGWSLSTEEQFYVVVPLVLLALSRVLGPRGCFVAIAGLLVLLPVARWHALAAAGWPVLGQHEVTAIIYTPFHTHADALVVGVLLGWLWVHTDAVRRPLRSLAVQAALLGIVVASVALRLLQKDLFAFTALAGLFGAAAFLALASPRVAPALARFRLFGIVSRLSYGMYLNHLFVLKAAGPVVTAALGGLGVYPAFGAGFVATFTLSALVAAATFVLIERPALEYRERRIARRRGSGEPAPADFAGTLLHERAGHER